MADRWMMRFRAECLADVARLILAIVDDPHIEHGAMMAPNIYGSPLGAIVVACMTTVPETVMRNIIKSIPDGHHMLRTLVYDEVFDGSACA